MALPHAGLLAAAALAALLTSGTAQAQATPPAKAASAPEMVGSTPNEAMQRQALSPYRFILNASAVKPAAKPAVAAAPATVPTPTAAAAPAAAPRQAPPSPAPAITKATPPPATEPAKNSAPATAPNAAPALATTAAPAPAAAPAAAPPAAPVLVAAASPATAAPQTPAPLPPPATVARRELVPLRQDPPAVSNAMLAEISQGRVKVRFDVNPDGSTSAVQVASSTHRKLNAPVIAAVSKWRFQPIEATRAAEIELSFSND